MWFTCNLNFSFTQFEGSIVATDADSSIFGQIEYALRGFGAERFHVNNITGEIFVNGCGRQIARACLDFETQKTYSLIYTGTDGGGQVIMPQIHFL